MFARQAVFEHSQFKLLLVHFSVFKLHCPVFSILGPHALSLDFSSDYLQSLAASTEGLSMRTQSLQLAYFA